MPYLITTSHTPEHEGATGYIVPRRAVATLEEARERLNVTAGLAESEQDGAATSLFRQIDALPESGGTVGPLPDGTVIEVKRVGLNELRVGTGTFEMTRDELIAAFNAREQNQ